MKTVAIIGAGNLAASIAPALKRAGVQITEVYSRTCSHAEELAEKVDATSVGAISELNPADFYILSVSDNYIEEAASLLPKNNAIVLHVSGSADIKALSVHCDRYGALYPFQTFSASRPVEDFSEIPVFIEADSKETLAEIKELAEQISHKVAVLDSHQRMGLHIAAVFACNFFNGILSCAFDICGEYGIDPSDLKPLTEETLRKAFDSGNPKTVQTGPAVRRDVSTMEKHLNLLQTKPELKEIYSLISKHIQEASMY
ncbi:MAG: DUF2520 domain-containing protein [Prevotellaceae bacterium]|jgi:predicted short-subunit dehydrogenase-like oxidoreductase (DUF2520 family)|nr:DUF2520 domain-containing protein [Prevotellaceae bacterium]